VPPPYPADVGLAEMLRGNEKTVVAAARSNVAAVDGYCRGLPAQRSRSRRLALPRCSVRLSHSVRAARCDVCQAIGCVRVRCVCVWCVCLFVCVCVCVCVCVPYTTSTHLHIYTHIHLYAYTHIHI